MIINIIFLRASVSLCVCEYMMFFYYVAALNLLVELNEQPLQRSDRWVLKLSAKCVLGLIDNNRE